MDAEDERREREKRVEEGRALFSAYQGSVQQLATGMIAVGERLERQNQLLQLLIQQQGQLVQQNESLLQSNQAVVEHLAQLQRQIAADVQVRGQELGIPIQSQPGPAQGGGIMEQLGQHLFQGAMNQLGVPAPQPPYPGQVRY